jgi:predicted house-cleaning noncanonical NTP pyrophosphatase (MazG superfamily)
MDELINNSDMHKATKAIHHQWYELVKAKIHELAEQKVSDEVATEIAKTLNIVIAGFKTMLYYEDDLESIKRLWKKQAHRLASYTDENKWRD